MNQNLDNQFSKENDAINIRAEIEKYLINWKWFLLSTIVCVSLAVVFMKTQVNVYQTNASVLVKEDGGASSELKVFQDLSSLGLGAKNNVYDEIEVLTSRSLAVAMVKKLKLNFEVYQQHGLKKVEQFHTIPFRYQVLSDLDNFYKLDTFIDITILDKATFKYQIEESEDEKVVKFGEQIKIGDKVIVLTPTESNSNQIIDKTFQVVFTRLDKVIEKYKNNINIVSADQDSNIINLSLSHPIKEKAELVLNTMVDLYNKRSIEDKNEVGKKTDEFIVNRLTEVNSDLDEIDKIEELYKKDKQITDIGFQSQVFVDSKTLNEQEIFKINTELSVVDYIIQSIQNQKNDFELLPASVGIEDNLQLSASVTNFNQLLLERNRLLRDSSPANPVVQNLNSELKNLRGSIQQSLINIKEQLEIALTSLNIKDKEFKSRITDIPQQAREYRSILRKQSIIAQLYSYLLQKKEENEISMAVTVPSSKVIDRAYSMSKPIAPKKPIIVLAGMLIGLIIPFAIIYLRDLLDTKFHTKGDLKGVVSVPLLGDIPFDDTEEKVVIRKGSRTSTAEAFRLLRTNLDFMLTPVGSKSKIVFVTSTISGEGKTFVSVNTAASLALTGKKVLLMGMDLRAPKITQYLDLPNRNGVTNYIIDKDANLAEMVTPLAGFENLDLLSSGVVPPNPAELLLSPKIGEMFEELRKMYDYIVVDTAPVNLVTDTLMLSQHADMFLYVSRANYLDKRMLEVPERFYREKRLPNMAILINGLDHSRGYGYGYGGYGYPAEENNKNFFQKIFKS
ncbi:GumC family protein [Wenyingzhuangia aestuarii]|uniref:GumC family protein n=1 Tax=Wenyingzhuangia aestuarii TaxID=1647582 RepID=UPI00143B44BD|nr:tyrosine-protein kinase [Wenyingzhuangia aestuarii]NJB83245.1 capsular exopolysaccharide synthesis family protein [Wenyingzhuangia aestuarii]